MMPFKKPQSVAKELYQTQSILSATPNSVVHYLVALLYITIFLSFCYSLFNQVYPCQELQLVSLQVDYSTVLGSKFVLLSLQKQCAGLTKVVPSFGFAPSRIYASNGLAHVTIVVHKFSVVFKCLCLKHPDNRSCA